MCGIFGYVGSRTDAPALTLKALKQLEYRGYDSWGVAFVEKGSDVLMVEKQVGKIGDAILAGDSLTSSLAIGHTRWATHGGVVKENAHPHLNASKTLALVHNGIIENYQELKQDLVNKGYTFVSQTDSEVFIHLVDEYSKNDSLHSAVLKAFQATRGLNAFVVLVPKEGKMITVSNGSSLVIGKASDGYVIASDSTAVALCAQEVYFPKPFELITLSANSCELVETTSMEEKRIPWEKLTIEFQDLVKGKYPYYLEKEIYEQPKVLHLIAKTMDVQIQELAKKVSEAPVFVGCGTAYYAALTGTYFFSMLAKVDARASSGGEFRYLRSVIVPSSFVTFLSQSGETIDIVEHLPILSKRGIAFGAIVNRLGSTLERATEDKVRLPAGPEQCVLATKSYTAKLAVLFLLAKNIEGKLDEGKFQLERCCEAIQELLKEEFSTTHIRPLVERIAHEKHMFFIGRGVSYPLALEASLKMKEVTYLNAEGFAGGELKHGVIALVEQGTLCFVFAPEDEEYEAVISNAMELKSRGAFIIGISSKNNEVFDTCIPVSNVGILSAIAQVVVAQLLAYYVATFLGNDPDKPRNLAKSVTVK